MLYAIDLVLRYFHPKVRQHYAGLVYPDDRIHFKTRLRRWLERNEHRLPVQLWALFLKQEWPREYSDAGEAEFPLCSVPFSDRWYEVMQNRVKRREHTWREGDVNARELEQFKFEGRRDDNGSTRLTRFSVAKPHCHAELKSRKVGGRIGNRRNRPAKRRAA